MRRLALAAFTAAALSATPAAASWATSCVELFCFSARSYAMTDGRALSLTLGVRISDRSPVLLLMRPHWQMSGEQVRTIIMSVDGKQAGARHGITVEGGIMVPLSADDVAMIANGRTLKLETPRERLTVELIGSRAAFKAALTEANNRRGVDPWAE